MPFLPQLKLIKYVIYDSRYIKIESMHGCFISCCPMLQDGLWVGAENGTVYFANTIPGFLKCDRAGSLPGCKFKFDYPDQQCAIGRNGIVFVFACEACVV